MKAIARKVHALRISLNLKQHEFGAKLRHPVPQGTVSKWELGMQDPTHETRMDIAELAGMPFQEFWGTPDRAAPVTTLGRRVQVIGQIAAGDWMEQPEWPENDRYWMNVVLPDKYAAMPLHALEVKGDSMNRYYPDGSIVFATALENVQGAPKSGMKVVVVRKSADGTYETTVKEYVTDTDGTKWLWPRSTSPAHQAPLEYRKKGDRTESVVIAGVVVAGLSMAI